MTQNDSPHLRLTLSTSLPHYETYGNRRARLESCQIFRLAANLRRIKKSLALIFEFPKSAENCLFFSKIEKAANFEMIKNRKNTELISKF